MLMVIFGAGASYDSWPSYSPSELRRDERHFRPPLANELFIRDDSFRKLSLKYFQCQPLIPYVENQQNVEEILEGFRAEAEHLPQRRGQLLAIQYYIREVIRASQANWLFRTHRVTNYRALVDRVYSERVCYVTFNYDILLEDALKAVGLQFPAISSYIGGNHKVFKLHGSTDWTLWISALESGVHIEGEPTEEKLIEAAPVAHESSGRFTRVNEELIQPQVVKVRYFSLPALAIPTLSKSSFFCPPEHVEELKRCIGQVDRIAVIGWRATERNFLDMLVRGLKSDTPILVACGTREDSEATLQRIKDAGVQSSRSLPLDCGFTNLIKERRLEKFLRP